jgi:hypothetical protein
MARRYEIGRNFYVITGKPAAAVHTAWSAAPNLVIQAHGGGQKSWFNLPAGIKVDFYVNHGETLKVATSPSNAVHYNYNYYDTIATVFAGNAVKFERFKGPGRCPNYYLSKFQVSQRAPTENKVAYDDLEQYVDRFNNLPYDIATVRERTFGGDPHLKELIQELNGSGHAYTKLHILICRTNSKGGSGYRIVTNQDMALGQRRFQ